METNNINGNLKHATSKLQTQLDPSKRPALPPSRKPNLVQKSIESNLVDKQAGNVSARPFSHPSISTTPAKPEIPLRPKSENIPNEGADSTHNVVQRPSKPNRPMRPRSGLILSKEATNITIKKDHTPPLPRKNLPSKLEQNKQQFTVANNNESSNLNKLKSLSAPDLSLSSNSKNFLIDESIPEEGDETDGQVAQKPRKKFSDVILNKFGNKRQKKRLPVQKSHSFNDPTSPASDQSSFEIIESPKNDRFSELHLDVDSQLFDYVVVVSLNEKQEPYITFQFPPKFEQAVNPLLESIPQFCFPDQSTSSNYKHGETFSFVLTSETGARSFGFCRMIQTPKMKHPEVCCIVSPYGLFTLYTQILEEVQYQRQFSSTAVFSFLKTILSKQLPNPTESLNVSFFSNGGNGGIRKVTLTRPGDSAIHEHVQIQSLFHNLNPIIVLDMLSLLLTENKLVLCSNSLTLLSSSCHILISLMYPFEWEHTLIPVLPTKLMDILCLPSPYLLGILPSVIPELEDLPMEGVSILNLDDGTWIERADIENILPKQISSQIVGSLKQTFSLSLDQVDAKQAQNEIISEIFVQMYLQLMGHFENHYTTTEDGLHVIGKKSFLKAARTKEQKHFLKLFAPTQAFQKFTTSRKQDGPTLGLFENRYETFKNSKSLDQPGYFKRHIDSMLTGFRKRH